MQRFSFLLVMLVILTACSSPRNEDREETHKIETGIPVILYQEVSPAPVISDTHLQLRLVGPNGEDMGPIMWPKRWVVADEVVSEEPLVIDGDKPLIINERKTKKYIIQLEQD